MSEKARNIVYVQYTNPGGYPPLEHSSQLWADRGWNVRFVGTRSRGDSDSLRFAEHPRIKVTLISYCSPGVRQKIHYAYFCLWSVLVALITRAEVVYASDGWSYPVGYVLSFLPGVKVILHEHDTPNTTSGLVNRIIGWFRKRLAGRAVTCIIPQGQRAQAFRESLRPRNLHVVWNCPSIVEVTGRRESSCDHAETLKLWFHGSIVPTQMPIFVLDAMGKLRKGVSLQFAGYETIGHTGYVQGFLTHANEKHLTKCVEHLGALPTRAEMYAAASQCDVGLALFGMNFREPMVGASNKPFDYLACGLALLVPDVPEWTDVFVASGCARACDTEDAHSIAAALEWFASNPEQTRAMGEVGRQLVCNEWNYESQFEKVLQFIEVANNDMPTSISNRTVSEPESRSHL